MGFIPRMINEVTASLTVIVLLALVVFVLIMVVVASIKIKKILKEDAMDEARTKEIVEETKLLAAKINELGRLLRE